MADRIDSERDCRTCLYRLNAVQSYPCNDCELGLGNYRSPDYWEPGGEEEDKKDE